MRKLFLLGTMLGVACTALAFGGVLGGGHKSTTYKGGVDAIGVHFGGEKSTDAQPEEICLDGIVKSKWGNCNICENGNLYVPYAEEPCNVDTDMNKTPCSSDGDCETACCGKNGYCMGAGTYDFWEGCPSGYNNCISNNDCDTGEFCLVDGSQDLFQIGICAPLLPERIVTYNNKVFVTDDMHLSVLGALNDCEARGMRMATAADLGFSADLVCGPYEDFLSCEGIYDWPSIVDVNLDFDPPYGWWLNDKPRENPDYGPGLQFHYILPNMVYWEQQMTGGDTSWKHPLCVPSVTCVEGTYYQNGSCVKSCSAYREQNGTLCACKANFIPQLDGSCVCPENFHIVNGECVECAGDETSAGNNVTECVKIDCNECEFPECCWAHNHTRDCSCH